MHPELAQRAAKLAPYAAGLVQASAEHALRLHAERVGVPHLLTTLMRDEDCAAHRAVLFAFGDPETIAEEAVALSEGVLVVGSGRSLPFSPRGVEAVEGARRAAVERGAAEVCPAHLGSAAYDQLSEAIQRDLGAAGLRLDRLYDEDAEQRGERPALQLDGPVLGSFDEATKRACGVACRVATQLARASISPAHLLLACLEIDPQLAQRSGLSGLRARAALAGRDEDESPLPDGVLEAEEQLLSFIEALEAGSDSLGLLLGLYQYGPESLRLLLGQHQLEAANMSAQSGVLRDP